MKQTVKGRIDTSKGRRSLFRGKRYSINGFMTPEGRQHFVAAKLRLEQLAREVTGRPAKASAGDVIEYLARGEEATREYLKGRL